MWGESSREGLDAPGLFSAQSDLVCLKSLSFIFFCWRPEFDGLCVYVLFFFFPPPLLSCQPGPSPSCRPPFLQNDLQQYH